MGRLTFYFTLLKYKYCISRYAIFRAILITVKDFVHLMSTNINHEHKVWSACDSTSISQSIFMLSTLHPSSSFPLPCFSTSQNKGGYFSKCLFQKLLLTFQTGPYARFGETNQIAARVDIQSDLRFLKSGQLFPRLARAMNTSK